MSAQRSRDFISEAHTRSRSISPDNNHIFNQLSFVKLSKDSQIVWERDLKLSCTKK